MRTWALYIRQPPWVQSHSVEDKKQLTKTIEPQVKSSIQFISFKTQMTIYLLFEVSCSRTDLPPLHLWEVVWQNLPIPHQIVINSTFLILVTSGRSTILLMEFYMFFPEDWWTRLELFLSSSLGTDLMIVRYVPQPFWKAILRSSKVNWCTSIRIRSSLYEIFWYIHRRTYITDYRLVQCRHQNGYAMMAPYVV